MSATKVQVAVAAAPWDRFNELDQRNDESVVLVERKKRGRGYQVILEGESRRLYDLALDMTSLAEREPDAGMAQQMKRTAGKVMQDIEGYAAKQQQAETKAAKKNAKKAYQQLRATKSKKIAAERLADALDVELESLPAKGQYKASRVFPSGKRQEVEGTLDRMIYWMLFAAITEPNLGGLGLDIDELRKQVKFVGNVSGGAAHEEALLNQFQYTGDDA